MSTELAFYKSQLGQRQVRELTVTPKVLDAAKGIIRYVASDETMDHSREIVRLSGWRFSHFQKNAPFVDSHDYSSITKLLGQVVGFEVAGRELVEDVQYALTEKGETLADWAFKMARDGFLRAVSVGFIPKRMVTKWDSDSADYTSQVRELKLDPANAAQLRAVYMEHEQIELSQCILGCNPNALAKAYKAGTLSEGDLDKLSAAIAASKTTHPAALSADAGEVSPRTKTAILAAITAHL